MSWRQRKRMALSPELEDRFVAALNLFQLMENRIGDLEYALKDAGIPIPKGRSEGERQERIAEGMRIMFPEGLPDHLRGGFA